MPKIRLRTLSLASAAALLLSAVPGAGAASASAVWPLTPSSLVTDAPVNSMTTVGDHTYLTGYFSQIGTFTGSGAMLNATTGAPAANLPAVNGQISYVLAAPDGGWYIGGNFTDVGGVPRAGLAKLNADGSLDASFAPQVSGFVDSLALNGSSLYLGGSFNLVDGAIRGGLAAVDASTGALLPFDAHESGDASELCFLPATATTPAVLYAGMGAVLALDPRTGDPLPGFHSNIQDRIDALAVNRGHLYVGGAGGMVALDPMTGVQDPNFQATPVSLAGQSDFRGEVDSIVVEPDRLLVGGTFNALGGASGPVVALDPTTGGADRTFRPQITGAVYDMDQIGQSLWIGGTITSVRGVPVSNIAVVDASSGSPVAVHTPRLDGQVNGIRVSADGQSVFAGGQFETLNALRSRGFAEIDNTTGRLDPSFVPKAPLWQTLAGDPQALVAAPLQYQGYDPHSRRHPFLGSRLRVQLLSLASGMPLPGRSPLVRNLSGVAVTGDQLYIDQRIGNRARFPVNVISVWSTRSGRMQRHFTVPLHGYVSALLFTHRHLFVAGSFKRRRPDGQPANLAILELSPHGALVPQFDPQANGPVYALSAHGNDIYFAGLFNRVWGAPRHGVAAISLSTDFVVPGFAPKVPGDNFTTLTPLKINLFLQSPFHVDFLTYGSAAVDPFLAAFGLRTPEITAVAPTSSGAVITGQFDTPLRDQNVETLYFVRTVPRS